MEEYIYLSDFFYLFLFLLAINSKLLIVQIEIKIMNKEAANKRNITLLHTQHQLCMVAVPSNKAVWC